jgi:hypothetical protein
MGRKTVMTQKSKIVIGLCGAFLLAGTIIFLATRPSSLIADSNGIAQSDAVLRSLREIVDVAKKGQRGGIDGFVDSMKRGDVKLSEAHLPEFASYLHDSDPQVQLLGATGLYALSSPKSKEPLIKYLKSVDTSLFRPKPEDHNAPVTEMKAKQFLWTWQAVGMAAGALAKVGDKSAIPALEAVKDCPPFENWDPVTEALAKLGAVKSLAQIGEGGSVTERARESSGIRAIRDPKKVPDLKETVRDPKARPAARNAAIEALRGINPPGIAQFFLDIIGNASYPSGCRCVALLAAGASRDPAVEKRLADLANDPNVEIRVYAVAGLVLYEPQKYAGQLFGSVMNSQEAPKFRARLLYTVNDLPVDLVRTWREPIYRCLEATYQDGRPYDEIRVTAWELIHEVFREERPVVLSGPSSPFIRRIRSILSTELSRTAYQASYEDQQKMADEQVQKIVSFPPQ